MIKRPDTRTLLIESFLELTDTMPIKKITVTNITNNCNLRRETFYRYFLDKYELINYIYVEYVQARSVEQFGKSDPKEICLYGLQFFQKHPVFVKEAFKDKGQNNFRESLAKSIINAVSEQYQKQYHLEHIPAKDRLALHLFVYGGVSIVTDWVESNFIMPDSLIADAIVDAIPSAFKELFNSSPSL